MVSAPAEPMQWPFPGERPSLRFRLLAVITAFLVVPATAASAAELTITNLGTIELTDTASQPNAVTVERSGPTFTFQDAQAIDVDPAASQCTQGMDPKRATCTFDTTAQAEGFDLDVNVGGGDDSVLVKADNDAELDGGDGIDELTGGPGDDLLNGGDSNGAGTSTSTYDLLMGGAGADRLDGGEGDDRLAGGPGADILQDEGTGGSDELRYSDDGESRPDGVAVTVASGDGDDGEAGEDDTVGDGFESFFLSPGSDEITGTGEDESFFGAAGSDVLHGAGGDDTFGDSAGGDTFDGGSDLNGDIVRFARFPDAGAVTVTIDDVANDGPNGGAEADDVRSTIEIVEGTESADRLVGGAGDETLDGRNGNDHVEGLGGADVLIGYFGDDTIIARDGVKDTVHCGPRGFGQSSDGSEDAVTADGGAAGDDVNCAVPSGDFVDDAEDPTFSNLHATAASDANGPVTVLRGTIHPHGGDTMFYFEWGTTTAYGSRSQAASVGGNQALDVNNAIGSVPAGTTLHFRLVAWRGFEDRLVWRSSDATYTVPGPGGAPAPAAVTGAASEITATTARLAGTVDPNGAATDYRFDYGTSQTELTKSTMAQPAGSGDTPQSVSAQIGSLQPATKYFFRMVAVRGDDAYAGDLGSFTTAAAAATQQQGGTTPGTTTPPATGATTPVPPPQGVTPVRLGGSVTTTSVPLPTQQGVPNPQIAPVRKGTAWTIRSLADAQRMMAELNLNVDFQVRRVGREGIPRELRDEDSFMRRVDANDVVEQNPTVARVPLIANAVTTGDQPGYRVTVYDPTRDRSLDRALDQKGCAYERRDAVGGKLREALAGAPLHTSDKKGAADRLDADRCTWELATVRGSTKATTMTVTRSEVTNARRQGLDGGRQPIVGLHVLEPKPAPAPASPAVPQPGAQDGRELNAVLSGGSLNPNGWQSQLTVGYATSGEVVFTNGRKGSTSTGVGQTFTVAVLQRATGEKIAGAKVEIVYISNSDKAKAGGEGVVVADKVTDSDGLALFNSVELPFAGKVTIRMSKTAGVRGDDSVHQLSGKRVVDVITRGCEPWVTLDGLVFQANKVGGKCLDSYKRITAARAAATGNDWWSQLGAALQGVFDSIFGKVRNGGQTVGGIDLRGVLDPSKVRACSLDDPKGANAKLPQAGRGTAVVIRPDGTETTAQAAALATSTGDACAMDRERIITDVAQFASTLKGEDLQIIRSNGGLLTPMLVAKVIATGGLNMTPEKAASVIATGGGNATAGQIRQLMFDAAGARRASFDIARVIATGGGNLIGQAGGNLIGQAGGNVIATGGLNFQAANTAGVIATGGGNLTLQQVAQVISTGGGNLNGNQAAGVIATGGGNFTPGQLANVISTGGGNIALATIQSWFRAASVISTGGGNILGNPNQAVAGLTTTNLIGQAGGNLIGQAGGNVIAVGGGNVISVGGGN